MRVFVVAIVLLLARTAHATGPCENTEARYDPPELFDESTQSFAVQVSQPWCDEIENGGAIDEKRGAVSFVQLRDTHDTVLRRLSTAIGFDALHLAAMAGPFEVVPYGQLHATLLKLGYKPLVSKLKDCTIKTSWVDIQPEGGWRAAKLRLVIEHAGKQVLMLELGEGSIARRGDQIVRLHVQPKLQQIALFVIVPSCAGPPPGYFGPDDGGDCYKVDTPKVVTVTAAPGTPLAACF